MPRLSCCVWHRTFHFSGCENHFANFLDTFLKLIVSMFSVCLICVPTEQKCSVWLKIKHDAMPYLKFNTGVCKIYTYTICVPPCWWFMVISLKALTYRGFLQSYPSMRYVIANLILCLFMFDHQLNVHGWVCVRDCASASPLRIYYLLYRKLPSVCQRISFALRFIAWRRRHLKAHTENTN